LVVSVIITTILTLRWINPPTTVFVLRDAARNTPWLYTDWAAGKNMSQYLHVSDIAAEDQRFFGLSWVGMVALEKVLFGKEKAVRGASTITRQLAKNRQRLIVRSFLVSGGIPTPKAGGS
jgi:monofunctional biosynthetic peptidoglycan transglycosylase